MNQDFFTKRIRELADLSLRRDVAIFSDFLTLDQQSTAQALALSRQEICLKAWGGYEMAERRVLAFCSPWLREEELVYPIRCLKITPKSAKFAESLTHRDYLGAILNLGLDRAVTGDILVQDKEAFLFCHERIAGFLMENLRQVRHTLVVLSPVQGSLEGIEARLEPVKGTVSSVRLDSLLHLAFSRSRSQMAPLIAGGEVYVNGRQVVNPSYEPKPGEIISVRHQGRFRYDGVSGETKKGRLGVELMRYI